jgi:hypothetical protein
VGQSRRLAFVPGVLVYLNTIAHGATLDDVMIVWRKPLARDIGEIGRVFTTNDWGFESQLPDTGCTGRSPSRTSRSRARCSENDCGRVTS